MAWNQMYWDILDQIYLAVRDFGAYLRKNMTKICRTKWHLIPYISAI